MRLRRGKLFAKRITVGISFKRQRVKHCEDFPLAIHDEAKFLRSATTINAVAW